MNLRLKAHGWWCWLRPESCDGEPAPGLCVDFIQCEFPPLPALLSPNLLIFFFPGPWSIRQVFCHCPYDWLGSLHTQWMTIICSSDHRRASPHCLSGPCLHGAVSQLGCILAWIHFPETIPAVRVSSSTGLHTGSIMNEENINELAQLLLCLPPAIFSYLYPDNVPVLSAAHLMSTA